MENEPSQGRCRSPRSPAPKYEARVRAPLPRGHSAAGRAGTERRALLQEQRHQELHLTGANIGPLFRWHWQPHGSHCRVQSDHTGQARLLLNRPAVHRHGSQSYTWIR